MKAEMKVVDENETRTSVKKPKNKSAIMVDGSL